MRPFNVWREHQRRLTNLISTKGLTLISTTCSTCWRRAMRRIMLCSCLEGEKNTKGTAPLQANKKESHFFMPILWYQIIYLRLESMRLRWRMGIKYDWCRWEILGEIRILRSHGMMRILNGIWSTLNKRKECSTGSTKILMMGCSTWTGIPSPRNSITFSPSARSMMRPTTYIFRWLFTIGLPCFLRSKLMVSLKRLEYISCRKCSSILRMNTSMQESVWSSVKFYSMRKGRKRGFSWSRRAIIMITLLTTTLLSPFERLKKESGYWGCTSGGLK